MNLLANDPSRKSWIPVPAGSDFPIQNLPFGVFIPEDDIITTGTRIGDTAIDLSVLHQLGYFDGIDLPDDVFLQDTLNDFIALGRPVWRAVRNRLAEIFDESNTTLKANVEHQNKALFPVSQVQMLMPVFVQDYTDFYSSIEHATNVGKMFRDPDNALLPNWKHIPVGYHGRSSSIVISGVDLHRPKDSVWHRVPMHRLLVQVSAWILNLSWHSSLAKASLWGTALKLRRRMNISSGWCCSMTGAPVTFKSGSMYRWAVPWKEFWIKHQSVGGDHGCFGAV